MPESALVASTGWWTLAGGLQSARPSLESQLQLASFCCPFLSLAFLTQFALGAFLSLGKSVFYHNGEKLYIFQSNFTFRFDIWWKGRWCLMIHIINNTSDHSWKRGLHFPSEFSSLLRLGGKTRFLSTRFNCKTRWWMLSWFCLCFLGKLVVCVMQCGLCVPIRSKLGHD